jgi:hypothetical protein
MYKGRRNVIINWVGIITCNRGENRVKRIMETHCSKIINIATYKTPSAVKYCHVLRRVSRDGALD